MNNKPVTCQPVTRDSAGATWIWIALLILSGCVRDDLHRTPHPDRGAVRLNVERAGSDGDATTYRVRVGEIEEKMTGGEGTLATLFAPGVYNLLVHDTPAGMTVDGTVVSVNTLPDGTLEPAPGNLFHDTIHATVTADDTLRVAMTLPRRTRQLTLQMALAGGDPSRVSSIEARLTGIIAAVDMADGTPRGEPATARPVFPLATLADNHRATGMLTATLNLLGVFPGSEQRLTLVITAVDGQQQTVETDMTATLAAFNRDNTPLLLNSNLQLMQTGDFDFIISDWTEGMPPGEGDAV